MRRFAALGLLAGLLLLMGCSGARQLDQICGAERWTSVQLVERYDRPGEAAEALSPDEVSPEMLRALLKTVRVKPAYASAQLPIPCVQLFLSCEDGTLCTLTVGENGRVVLTTHAENAGTQSCWNTDSAELYHKLLSMAG